MCQESAFKLLQGRLFHKRKQEDFSRDRTPPKTQSALLEGMEEQQITLDGETLALPALFWAIATQNPLEFEGTYPLPEAQLDGLQVDAVVGSILKQVAVPR